LPVSVDYHVAPATVIGIVMQATAHIEGVARERPCIVRVASFADSAVIYEVKYFTRDYSLRDRVDADIRKAIWYALHRNGIAFATPVLSYAPYTPPKLEHSVPADVIALTDVVALEIGKESLQPILQQSPELAGAISEKVLERRDHLAMVRAESEEEETQTVLSRIRAYFGL